MANLFDSLGRSIGLAFPEKRNALPRESFYAPQAPARLATELLGETQGRRALILSDLRTHAIAGAQCLQALQDAGWTCEEILVPDKAGSPPVCDDATRDQIKAQLPAADAFVAVGSGVINDLTKWLAFEADVPYAVLATAASMNGYSAANVAPSIRGVKSLVRAKAPRFIGAIPSVIESAPWELTSAGLGDVVAKPVSTADWIMNQQLFAESFSQPVADLVNHIEPAYYDHPEELARRDPTAIRALFDALVWSGCAMTLQGSSLPASGGEHLISHTLDMLAPLKNASHDLHGRQVGVATIVAAALYQEVFSIDRPSFFDRAAPFDAALWGPIAPAVQAEHAKKRVHAEQACRRLSRPGAWDRLRRELTPLLRQPRDIKNCLARAGGAHRLKDIGCSTERFLLAVTHCGAIRGRFTSIDLGWITGLLPQAAEKIVEEFCS